jgi:taurine dioxygenase
MSAVDTQVRIVPRTPAFGARVDGLDGRQPLSAETVQVLKDAIHKYKVLFFPEQNLTDSEQSELASCFGEPFEHHSNFSVDYEDSGLSDITVVSHFHSDVMYMSEQPAYAMLQMLEVPETGGDTMWADLVSSYEALSQPVRDFIETLTAVNVHPEYYVDDATLSRRYEARYGHPLTAEQLRKRRTDLAPNEHPVVRVIPETGRKSYYVSAQHTSHIKDLSHDESDAVLQLLFKQQLKPEFVIRWDWTPGDIAFWDHRTTLHSGVNDYGPGQKRRGRRANIGCVSPVAASRA